MFQTAFRRISRSNVRRFCLQTEKAGNESQRPKKIFSGIQPTGSVHLGNYLGAIVPWLNMQNKNDDITLCVVDLHSITLPQNPKMLSANILEMTATLLACGIDPDKSTLFQQSMVPHHTELCWQLGCIATMARLAHLPQFKEKSAKLKDIPLGLFVYPVLQAADILLYKATHVPVGEDQLQHLQLAQDLARMFNKRFGVTFPIPHSLVVDTNAARLKSLRDPTKKMSKSDPDPKSRISLTDTPDDIVKNFKKAVTDFTSKVTYDPENRPGVSNMITIHSALTGKTPEEICKEVEDIDTGRYKFVVADAVIEHLKPIREKMSDYLSDPQYLLNILEKGANKATIIADNTISEVRNKLGLTQQNIIKKEKLKIKS